jgi:hypothetical protein
VLARLERADRPLDVQRVGQRDVDGVDLVVGEERLVAAVRPLDAVLARVGLRPVLVAARDRDDPDPVARAGQAGVGVMGPREQAEAKLSQSSSRGSSAG